MSDEIGKTLRIQEERYKRRMEDLRMRGGISLREAVRRANYPELYKDATPELRR